MADETGFWHQLRRKLRRAGSQKAEEELNSKVGGVRCSRRRAKGFESPELSRWLLCQVLSGWSSPVVMGTLEAGQAPETALLTLT